MIDQTVREAHLAQITTHQSPPLNQFIQYYHMVIGCAKLSVGVSSLGVGMIAVLLAWNPVGWLMYGIGLAVGLAASTYVNRLKDEVATLQGQISADIDLENTYKKAAQIVATFTQAAQSAASMNEAAQQELYKLVQLWGDLDRKMNEVLADIDVNDYADAYDEALQIAADAEFLKNIAAYSWPNPAQLINPSNFLAGGSQVYQIDTSGRVYRLIEGGNTWATMKDFSLSVVATETIVAAIDGAPKIITQAGKNAQRAQTFFVKLYDAKDDSWSTISTFPVSQIACDKNGTLWAIQQDGNNRPVYRYDGSGTAWTAVRGAIPDDVPGSIAACAGTLFAIANNSNGLWKAGANGWQQVGSAKYSGFSANGNYLGLIDNNGNAWVCGISDAGTLSGPYKMMETVTGLAQMSNGNQWVIGGSGNLWYVERDTENAVTCTKMKDHVIAIEVSDKDKVFAMDSGGNIWSLVDIEKNTWRELPTIVNEN